MISVKKKDRDNYLVLNIEDAIKQREQGGIAFELHIPEFRLYKGEFVGIVGESGCGKSTLLDMIALVSRPTECKRFELHASSKTQKVNKFDIKKLWQENHESKLADLRRDLLGYVLQSGGLLPFLTVEQNIKLPWQLKELDANPERFKEFVSKMGVVNLLKKKPQYLSGGQRQRIAILRALIHNPMIILADEPTAAVDTGRAEAIINDFYGLAKKFNNTIVVVTHNFQLIKDLADKVYTYRVTQISETLTRSMCVPYNK